MCRGLHINLLIKPENAFRDKEGKTPTDLALLKGHHEVASVLRQFGGEDSNKGEQVRSEFKGYVFATEEIRETNRPSPHYAESQAPPGLVGICLSD